MDSCSICKREVDSENAAILAMGGFGNPRYMCEDCRFDFDELTLSRDTEGIKLAAERIGKKMADAETDDKLTLRTVEEIMKSAGERKTKIEAGNYDFSEEEIGQNNDGDEVPPELLESEEDAKAELEKAEKYAKLDTVTNWILLAVFIAALAFIIYKIFF